MSTSKTIFYVITGLLSGAVAGGLLGFFVPYGFALLMPQHFQALSFFPMVTLPAGVLIGGIIGGFVGFGKARSAKSDSTPTN